MEKSHLISVRIEPEVMQRLEEHVRKQARVNRSFVINRILNAVLSCADASTIHQMLITGYPREKGFVIRFEVEKGKIKERLDLSLNEKS